MQNKSKHVLIALSIMLVALWPAGCDEDSDGLFTPIITGSVVDYSECGGFPTVELVPWLLTDQTAAVWSYDGQGRLEIWHVNGAFNCCPEISCSITTIGQNITIREKDDGVCDCLCLVDAIFEVTGLSAGIYNIKIEELHLVEGDQPLEFTITLTDEPAYGSFIVDRDHLPWYPAIPNGGVVFHSGCGGYSDSYTPGNPPEDSVCIGYYYVNNRLGLAHRNEIFNCCIDYLTAEIEVEGNHITISEIDVGESPCLCLCPYDLDIFIYNLRADEYHITVITPYRDNPVEFTIDLVNEPEGYYCYEDAMGPE